MRRQRRWRVLAEDLTAQAADARQSGQKQWQAGGERNGIDIDAYAPSVGAVASGLAHGRTVLRRGHSRKHLVDVTCTFETDFRYLRVTIGAAVSPGAMSAFP